MPARRHQPSPDLTCLAQGNHLHAIYIPKVPEPEYPELYANRGSCTDHQRQVSVDYGTKAAKVATDTDGLSFSVQQVTRRGPAQPRMHQEELKMAPRGRPTRTTRSRPVTTTPPPVTDPTTTTSVTSPKRSHDKEVLRLHWQHVIQQGMVDDQAILRDDGTEGVVGLYYPMGLSKMESMFSNYAIAQSAKSGEGGQICELHSCKTMSISYVHGELPMFFKTNNNALTWWNSHVKTTTPEAAHAMP
ncbi:hypothetical protein Tco_0086061 [Tanacetum coccineum]